MMPTKQAPTTKPLSYRMQQFVINYPLCNGNATQAATKAGYSPIRAHVTGCQLVSNSKVQAALVEQASKVSRVSYLSIAQKRQQLLELATNENVRPADRIRALELDSKIAGHFAPDVSLQAHVSLDRDTLSQIALSSRADARQIIEGQIKRLQVATEPPQLDNSELPTPE